MAEREFIQVRLPQENGASTLNPTHDFGIFGRDAIFE